MRIALALVTLAWLVVLRVSPVAAHIELLSPQRRAATNPLLDAPCGRAGPAQRGTFVSVYAPGDQISVQWEETVPHPGHYRVAFDTDGEDFPDPKTLEDVAAAGAELGQGVSVLADGIPEREPFEFDGPAYELRINLPNIECENCTLQVIQVAGDSPAIYHDCANIALRIGGAASPAPVSAPAAAVSGGAAGGIAAATSPGPVAPAATSSSGCSLAAGAVIERGAAWAVAAGVLLVCAAQRRRRRPRRSPCASRASGLSHTP